MTQGVIKIIERRRNGVAVFTVLIHDIVYIITRDRKIAEKFIRKENK
jgi:hypothetical protein